MDTFKKASLGDKIFYIVITIVLTLFFLAVLYPCIYVISASFSAGAAINAGKVVFLPVRFTLDSYDLVLSDPDVWRGFANSIFYTVTGTLLSVTLTMSAAYCLSRKDFPGGNLIMMLFVFTMFFSGGLIPSYIVVSKLKLTNTIWSVILPPSLSAYNLIVARTFIVNSIPQEIFDAAMVDGCSDLRYFLQIVLPLSKAIIAVLVLFFGVSRWNAYFQPMLYLSDRNLYPLALVVRDYLIVGQVNLDKMKDPEKIEQVQNLMAGMKYALIVISTVPVMLLYPLIQKYFTKGVMIGSVKG